MKLLEDMTLTDSIEIRTAPDKVFGFLAGLVDDASYRAWHPADHVAFRWLKGQPWEEKSVMYAEEYIHGKLHKLKFVVTKVVPNKLIEYVPTSRLLRDTFQRMYSSWSQMNKGVSSLLQARFGWVGSLRPLPKTNLRRVSHPSRST